MAELTQEIITDTLTLQDPQTQTQASDMSEIESVLINYISERPLSHPLATPTTIKLKDRYNNTRATFLIETSPMTLPIIKQGGHYYEVDGVSFIVYEGVGMLEWEDALKCYNFLRHTKSLITLKELESHLLSGNRKADTFNNVYSINIKKGIEYIKPLGYSVIDEYLTSGVYNA